jgi:hypothetical protein
MKAGDIVEIQGHTISGIPCVEGKAKLIKPMTPSGMANGQMWEVHFLGDEPESTFYRWIREPTVVSKVPKGAEK